jgi:hypothetical protein
MLWQLLCEQVELGSEFDRTLQRLKEQLQYPILEADNGYFVQPKISQVTSDFVCSRTPMPATQVQRRLQEELDKQLAAIDQAAKLSSRQGSDPLWDLPQRKTLP